MARSAFAVTRCTVTSAPSSALRSTPGRTTSTPVVVLEVFCPLLWDDDELLDDDVVVAIEKTVPGTVRPSGRSTCTASPVCTLPTSVGSSDACTTGVVPLTVRSSPEAEAPTVATWLATRCGPGRNTMVVGF